MRGLRELVIVVVSFFMSGFLFGMIYAAHRYAVRMNSFEAGLKELSQKCPEVLNESAIKINSTRFIKTND